MSARHVRRGVLFRFRPFASAACLFTFTNLFALSLAAAQKTRTAPADVPPVSMTCPMHPEIVESVPGTCPLCKMNLVPMRLDTAWTCPIHAVVIERQPGECPVCRRQLVQVTVAVTWTCANRPDISQIDPGTCPDGTVMVAQRTLRPHGNHNPQHGGQFFMAPDNFHHLEGTHPLPQVFRMYLYDDYARPLPANQIKAMKGRVVTAETFDAATRTTTDIASFPLVMGRKGPYLEARMAKVTLPAQMTAKIQFKDGTPEYRFDFTFQALSVEPAPQPTVVSRTRPASDETPSNRGGGGVPAASQKGGFPRELGNGPAPAVAATGVAAGTTASVTGTVEELLTQLKSQQERLGELVRQGDFAAVWVPAFQAKDVAVALESRVDQLPHGRREQAGSAISLLVRTSWLLDAFGDIGNRQQIESAYTIFTAAVRDVTETFR